MSRHELNTFNTVLAELDDPTETFYTDEEIRADPEFI